MNILDEYVMKTPSTQNAIDMFKDEWSSKIPGDFTSGHIDLFNDGRLDLFETAIDGFKDKRILELGPLEAAHTALMLTRGANNVLAIEANSRAYVKCLIVKETLKLNKASFLLGDFNQFLINTNETYDFVLACGVIYHCFNPVETLVNLTKHSDKIGIWTQYYQEKEVRALYGEKFIYEPVIKSYEGYSAECYQHNYMDALNIKGFCGGGNKSTFWMDKKNWARLFNDLDYDLIFAQESTTHPNGPEFTATAIRR